MGFCGLWWQGVLLLSPLMVWKLRRLLIESADNSTSNNNNRKNTVAVAVAVDGFKCIHSVVSMSRIKEGGKIKVTWSDLKGDLFQLILQRLNFMDALKCRQACLSWKINYDNAVSTNRIKFSQPPPFLLFSKLRRRRRRPNFATRLIRNILFLPTPNTNTNNNDRYVYVSDLNQEHDKLVYTNCNLSITDQCKSTTRVYTVEGWLAFLDLHCDSLVLLPRLSYSQLSFFNPVSGVYLELPPLPFRSSTGIYHIDLISLTLVFSSAPHSPSFTVAFLVHFEARGGGEPLQLLAFYKRSDKSWTLIHDLMQPPPIHFVNIAIDGCQLYAIKKDKPFDSLFVFDIWKANAIRTEYFVIGGPKPWISTMSCRQYSNKGIHYIDDFVTIRMVAYGGQVFLVHHLTDAKFKNYPYLYASSTKAIRVFKLDRRWWPGWSWLQVDTLGDQIWLMDVCGIQVIKDVNHVQGNCIYFSYANTLPQSPNHDIGVFSLKDKRIKYLSLDSSLPFSGQDFWFIPDP
ncbi:hypothetical protein RIF29_25568 [Crotalaria pallida]|uniref:KIB1-4 beta-propeller domain-containing protein n=1 Tax=Crotalaria pallida TaxID=3830 RepID=A0AAN9EMP0_CROPI